MAGPVAGLALAALSAAACASGGGEGGREVVADVSRPGSVTTMEMILVEDEAGRSAVLDADREAVWDALYAAYQGLGIEVRHADTSTGVMGNRDLELRRRLGGERLSRYFDCGDLVSGGAAADRFVVNVEVLSRITPSGEGTRVATSLAATGRDPGGTSRDEVRCTSRGTLEAEILERTVAGVVGDG